MSAAAALRAFGRFWWEFIVGDTPELAVGVAAVLLAGWGLVALKIPVTAVLIPAALLVLLAASVWRGKAPD